jgi:nucleoside 2-deoxyribosyltransferase
MSKVYLAGPILGQTYQGCNDWREYSIKWLAQYEIKGVSPMRAKLHLNDGREITDNYEDALCCSRGIITCDGFDVMNCDMMLANLLGAKRVSIGTIGEFFWADAYRKPVIAVMEKEGNPHEHAMIREITGFRVETLEEGLAVVRAVLG